MVGTGPSIPEGVGEVRRIGYAATGIDYAASRMHWSAPCGVVAVGLMVGASAYMLTETPSNALDIERPVMVTPLRAETLNEALTACGEGTMDAGLVRDCRESAYAATWPDWLPHCTDEDSSTACVWVADERGSLDGESFVVTDGGHVEYVTHEYARSVVKKSVTEA